ncbi:universal stress protein UspA [Herbaspirillum sp. HC18]|nr:universal stress protein UspA [Herbaspirillum sp. HC18]
MYRHLLVPIDHSDLSTVTVGQAVEFARVLGARITFFHAQPDHSASLRGDAEIVRLTSAEEFNYNFQGRARELLTKAESAARAQGVPCSSATLVNDKPYSAILAMARSEGCDLIFMASHGRRSTLGMMLGSQTLKVLVNSEIPVLVAAMADPPAPEQAIATIRDEHRSLAAVLHAWLHLLKSAELQGGQPDVQMMKAMVHYIQVFPVALHHPKEEDYLFRKLRERTSAINAEINELNHQHERDEKLVAELAALVDGYAAGTASFEELKTAVSSYATFIWEHLGREEGVILPAAQHYLTGEDWIEINAAFSENLDPRFGGDTDAEFKRLFSRIVNLPPAGKK